jgi:hypothetical protein
MRRYKIILYLGLLTNFIFGQCSISSNLVTNGDFESGNSGFTSDYSNSPGDLWDEGTFDAVSNPVFSHSNFSPCSDASAGSGVMLAVNGSQTEDAKIWCQTVAVEADEDYTFSTEITSVHASNVAILQFSINGTDLGTSFIAPTSTCTWNQFCESWNAGVNTSADICIVNKNTASSGNDFALDNISMGKVLAVLPVTLGSFEVVNENADVRLNWVSYVEENHDRFEIERSLDGMEWSFIGSTSGTLLQEDSANYKFYDHLPKEGLNYYRLKMISNNGEVEFSDIRVIDHVFYSVDIVQTFPNPVRDEMNIRLRDNVDQISIINNMGKTIYLETNPSSNHTISTSNLSSGTYYLNFRDNKGKLCNKLFIKQ